MDDTMTNIIKELDAPIPVSAVSTRDGGRGIKLAYLEGWYVIDRLNKILGQGNWAYQSDLFKTYEGTVKTQKGETNYVSYGAKVRLVVKIGNVPTEFQDIGFGDGQDINNPGKAHELAMKEAVTDGLKRCAKNLGMSFGLALYDKSREFVTDDTESNNTNNSTTNTSTTKKFTRENVDKLIDETLTNIVRRGIMTSQEVREALTKKFGVNTKAQMTDQQATEAVMFLRSLSNN